MFAAFFNNNSLDKQTLYFACLSNFVALKGGAIKREQSISADMATIMGNLYLAHCVKIYNEHMQISENLTTIVIQRLLNENIDIFNRVLYNLNYYPILNHMYQSKKESYKLNENLIKELKSNDKIMKDLMQNMYLDEAIQNMLELDKMHSKSQNYADLYQKIISVGEYTIDNKNFVKIY